MSASDQQRILDFLSAGGALYVEGTNVGEDHNGTAFWDALGASYLGQGPLHGDISTVAGEQNSFLAPKIYDYMSNTDADIYINRFAPGTGEVLLSSHNPDYARVITHENGQSRTIVSSLIFGALADDIGFTTKVNLMQLYLNFLTNKQEPTIQASEESIDLGLTMPNGAISDTLYIQNIGGSPLDVSSITLNGNAFSISALPSVELAFGMETPIIVTYPAANSGDFTGSVDIISNDLTNTVLSIPVSASSYQPPTVNGPTSLTGEAQPGETASDTFTLSNSGELPLDYWLDIRPDNPRAGGPDGFGYSWTDSNDPGGPEYSWEDISATGTLLELTGSNSFIEVDLPFGFPFYGSIHNQIKITSNGYLTFHEDGTDRTNDPIPNVVYPNDSLFPFWDNLSADSGSLYYWQDAANNRVIIQYSDWTLSSGYGNYSFQIHLYNNGDIYFYYEHMEGTLTSATIGIENQDGTDGLQIAYNEPYMEDQLAIKISSGIPWLFLDAYTGTILPGDAVEVAITFDATTLSVGDYTAALHVNSNDPIHPQVIIPTTLHVAPVSADAPLTNTTMTLQNFPNPFNPSTTISFSLPRDAASSSAELQIFNSRGQLIRSESLPLDGTSSTHSFVWDGTDKNRATMASGLYFYRVKAGKFTASKKMLLMK